MTPRRFGGLVLMAAAALLLGGCGGPWALAPTASVTPPRTGLSFIDTVLVPVTAQQAAGGVLFGTRIHNGTEQPLSVVMVSPHADIPGVTVQYMGYSDCSNGCPGSELWDAASQDSLKTQLAGSLPLTVPAHQDRWTLVFLEQVDPSTYETHACTSVHTITMSLSTGNTVTVAIPDGHSPVFGIASSVDNKAKC